MNLPRARSLLTTAAVCLGGALFVGIGGFTFLERSGESSLEFVGNLISKVHHISLDQLDPTCPQCL